MTSINYEGKNSKIHCRNPPFLAGLDCNFNSLSTSEDGKCREKISYGTRYITGHCIPDKHNLETRSWVFRPCEIQQWRWPGESFCS